MKRNKNSLGFEALPFQTPSPIGTFLWPQLNFTATIPLDITAEFGPELRAAVSPPWGGNIGYSYAPYHRLLTEVGTDIALYSHDDFFFIRAVPNSGWVFDYWTGDGTSNVLFDERDIVMDAPQYVTAVFVEQCAAHVAPTSAPDESKNPCLLPEAAGKVGFSNIYFNPLEIDHFTYEMCRATDGDWQVRVTKLKVTHDGDVCSDCVWEDPVDNSVAEEWCIFQCELTTANAAGQPKYFIHKDNCDNASTQLHENEHVGTDLNEAQQNAPFLSGFFDSIRADGELSKQQAEQAVLQQALDAANAWFQIFKMDWNSAVGRNHCATYTVGFNAYRDLVHTGEFSPCHTCQWYENLNFVTINNVCN